MKVTYKVTIPIGDYRAIEQIRTLRADSCFRPDGCGLIYFRINQFEYRTIPADDIISIEK